MYLFHNDYNRTAHPAVLKKLMETEATQFSGYGKDDCCNRARKLIRRSCENERVDVHFLTGGTQANLAVLTASLRPHHAVLGAESAHINVHETGAIEATGHKVVTLPSKDGKITAEQVEAVAAAQQQDENAEHVTQVKMVYITHPTELGTTYRLAELEALSKVCKNYGLHLFLDGARLGYALAAEDNDITMADLARLCDVFYLGGTKVGAMFGEAVIFSNLEIARDFRYIIKQRGGLLAKGWLLGVQFEALLEDGLYVRIAKHGNVLADRLRSTLNRCGYPLLLPGTTNQVFAILPNGLLDKLSSGFSLMLHERIDEDHSAVRICTSWATGEEEIAALCDAISAYKNMEGDMDAN